LTICGELLPDYETFLTDLLRQPGVTLRGFTADVPEVLAEADVLLLPSVTEGSALVTYEAMGSGCVPLVSSAAGAPIRHETDGLVHDVGEVGELAAQLRRLATRPDELERLRQGCLAARQQLTWEAAGRVLAGAYRTCLDQYATQSRSRTAFS
jgi:D-inositol-3-phosphate glycosyltransferase